MRLHLRSLVERLRASLFFLPMVGVLAGAAAGQLGVTLDRRVDDPANDLPVDLASTVESARALLSTIAGATITFAGIAFSISMLTIQMASSQYSPRVVHTLFRDPFNRRVMAVVVGTFTYSLMVLRAVRSATEEGGEAFVPSLSVALAVALGIATILAVVAFISHSAHAMDVSQILEKVRRDAADQIRREWREVDGEPEPLADPEESPDDGCVLRFDRTGWVQALDHEQLLDALPPGTTLHLRTYPGRYAVEGAALGIAVPPPDDPPAVARAACAALALGDTRTMQQDVSYGLRQLADVALRALSPGINDPTTAQDAIFHSAAVLGELLVRDPPPRTVTADDGRRLMLPEMPTHQDLVGLAYDELRRAAVAHPTVCVYLLESLSLLTELVGARGLPDREGPLREQARLVVAGCEAAELLPHDLRVVEGAFRARF